MNSGYIPDATLGYVKVTVRANCRRITARWKNGTVNLSVPPGIGEKEVRDAIKTLTPRLLKVRPTLTYSDGQRLNFEDFGIAINSQTLSPDKIFISAKLPLASIEVGSNIAFEYEHTTQIISRAICRICHTIAPHLLIDQAYRIADNIGLRPKKITVSSGHRILGHCNARGEIALSSILILLPHDLRCYVICHELAHLREMNHSERFHKLLNSYVQGNEASLAKKLREYKWPILRK